MGSPTLLYTTLADWYPLLSDRSATPESHFHPCYFGAAAASHARCDPGQPAAT